LGRTYQISGISSTSNLKSLHVKFGSNNKIPIYKVVERASIKLAPKELKIRDS
jgi:hypothetical protein